MAARSLQIYRSCRSALLIVDGFVIALVGLMFGPELALYALIAVFVTTKGSMGARRQNYTRLLSLFPTRVERSVRR